MKRIDVATPEEVLEAEMVLIGGAGLKVQYVGFQRGLENDGIHLYNLVEPRLPGYTYDGTLPTFSLTGLKELGLVR